ncbi:MAG TPA: hypothetical protein PLV45_12665 [bacterium]|nr:hypothetical protein [bacterium]
MQRLLLILIFMGTSAIPVAGQLVLSTEATGTQTRTWFWSDKSNGRDHTWSYYTTVPTMSASFRYRSYTHWGFISIADCIMEFNIEQTNGGNEFPTDGMTPSNWMAFITGLYVKSTYYWNSRNLTVRLYDLEDDAEDGVINEADRLAMFGDPIEVLIDGIMPPFGTALTPIEVTNQLRYDLYGFGPATNITTGFYIGTESTGEGYRRVRLDSSMLRLHVYVEATPSFPPTNTPTFTPTPTPTPTLTVTPRPTLTPTMTLPPTPSPAQTPSPTVTHTPLPTWTPPPAIAVDVWMPTDYYRTNLLCSCTVDVFNTTNESLQGLRLFAVLDVQDQLFFAPDFEGVSWYELDIDPGRTTVTVLPVFRWPENAASAENVHWYAALTDPEVTHVIGEMDTFTFGWGP